MKNDEIKDKTCAELVSLWRDLSATLPAGHEAAQYQFTTVHGSNAKYLMIALAYERDAVLPPVLAKKAVEGVAATLPLSLVVQGNLDSHARMARAIFLYFDKGLPVEETLAAFDARSLTIDGKTRKHANGIADAARRVQWFFRKMFGHRVEPASLHWDPVGNGKAGGRVLANAIRNHHILAGKTPGEATPDSVAAAIMRHERKALGTAMPGTYNGWLRELRAMVEDDKVPGITPELLVKLQPVYTQRRGAAAIVPETEIIHRFPEDFFEDPQRPSHIDLSRGVLGFFNRGLIDPPKSPDGKLCPFSNRLGDKALRNRGRFVRQYVFRFDRDCAESPLASLRDYFHPDNMLSSLKSRIARFGEPTITVRTEYMHAVMIACRYFGHDVAEFVEHVKSHYSFPSHKMSTRGEMAARQHSVQTVNDLVDVLMAYAAEAEPLTGKKHYPGRGVYLVRKSAEVDHRLRVDTGLRPGVLDVLEVVDSEFHGGHCPTIFRAGSGWEVHVPWKWMKQHAHAALGNAEQVARIQERDRGNHYVKGYHFHIERQLTVQALNNYIENGWQHAIAVVEGRTRRLLLNSHGEEFDLEHDKTAQCIRSIMREACFFASKRLNRNVRPVPRYYHRHILGTAVERHMPGHGLKRAYLTHSFDRGSDWVYGLQDNTLLYGVLDEVLRGLPPRAEQEREKRAEDEARMREMQETIRELLILSGRSGEHSAPPAQS